jgi:3-methyladenine DNA glycosylase AlkD
MPNLTDIERVRAAIAECADPHRAKNLQWFFKTGPGEYGEGDIFLGVRVPDIRRIAASCAGLPLDGTRELLRSPVHEERLLSLLILVLRYERGDEDVRRQTYAVYMRDIRYINQWDLVDCSAPRIVGRHLVPRSRRPLYRLAASRSLWKRRIAIMATAFFIRQGEFDDTLAIADMLLRDPEDLIHKSVGWMLREIGNRNRAVEEEFLRDRYRHMPRTMLRYAIEKFPETRRQRYLKGLA